MEAQGSIIINNMKISTSSGTVYWQENEPVEPIDGDTWFKIVNGSATNAYNRENGVWVEVEFASQLIAEELVGKIITAAEINGGEINGTTIIGAEFLNEYENITSGVNQVTDGKLGIKDGILQAGSTYYLTNSAGERLYKFATTEADIHQGTVNLRQRLYNETGSKTSESTTSVSGGLISLSLSDASGNYHGVLDAKGLTKTPWITIKLGPDFAVAENNPPQYRISYNLDGSRHVAFRGQFKLVTGNMNVGTPYCPFRLEPGVGWTHTTTLPQSIAPEVPAFAALTVEPVSGGAISGRMGLSTDCRMGFLPGTASKHVNLQGFAYDID